MIAATARAQITAPERGLDVVRVDGALLRGIQAVEPSRLRLYACDTAGCKVIDHQVDERDARGQWVLTDGPAATTDDPASRLDDNDVLLFAARDAGVRAPSSAALPVNALAVIELDDPIFAGRGWVYLALDSAGPPAAPAAAALHYDPARDRLTGAGMDVTFTAGIPTGLTLGGGPNLLDRLKVRASASFLWLRFTRSEDDLSTELLGWRSGPIRIVRAQTQRVRLGWGIRSPAFLSYAFYYRGFAELPVSLRLNFPPTYFFSDVRVQALLDFRDLRGWRLLVPSRSELFDIEGKMSLAKKALDACTDPWFALVGPQHTLVHYMGVSSSLDTARKRLVYREDALKGEPPESLAGELPAVGYQLDQWERVGAGVHSLQATSYVIPNSLDVRRFMAAQQHPLQVSVTPLPAAESPR